MICAPVVPEITDRPKDLEALVRAVAEAGGKYIFANSLFLKPCSAAIFLPFLEEKFPELAAGFRKRYETHAFLTPAYRKRLSQLMAKLREKYKIHNEYDRYSRRTHPVAQADPEQMKLF